MNSTFGATLIGCVHSAAAGLPVVRPRCGADDDRVADALGFNPTLTFQNAVPAVDQQTSKRE